MGSGFAVIFGAAVRQDAQQADAVSGKEGDNPVIQQAGGGDRRFPGVELTGRHPRIGIDEGLLLALQKSRNVRSSRVFYN